MPYEAAGIAMEQFDLLPNYWDTVPHTIKKRTDRPRSCDAYNTEGDVFLMKDALIKDGSNTNEGLIYTSKPIEKQEVA